MPTIVIKPGATIFVTGVNGLIGSHVVDQLLVRGYNVRGAVRDIEKTAWLKDYFDDKYPNAKLDMVAVPDMTADGCYDTLLKGCSGFIHIAAPVGGITSLPLALSIGLKAGLNALTACAKTPSITRFVNTSSILAATYPRPDAEHDVHVDASTYNDEALVRAEMEGNPSRGLDVYAAAKGQTEKAMWKWVEENGPGLVMNSILPNANFGPVLLPPHQSHPSTIAWAHAAFTGENFPLYSRVIPPQWFISVQDTALLHISALIHAEVNGERLYGCAERWNWNSLLAIYRKVVPVRDFPADVEGQGMDRVVVPRERAEEVLGWVKGGGWDGLEGSVGEMCGGW